MFQGLERRTPLEVYSGATSHLGKLWSVYWCAFTEVGCTRAARSFRVVGRMAVFRKSGKQVYPGSRANCSSLTFG